MAAQQATPIERADLDEDYDPEADGHCWKCDSQGFILVCCDDLCHGQGWCMHGDGEVICPLCKGESGW